ncbi:MAG TPA: lipid-binding SYLF domain-containing protein [Hanamia sp.]|nr:lipid-binding SYLF domain-containing protein [Hanamia sp.]
MKTSKIASFLLTLALSGFLFVSAKCQEKQQDKIDASTKVLKDFSDMKGKIPTELLQITQGIIVVPKLINAGFVVGGKRGRGIAMVKNPDGTWSDPLFVTITGGSVGFQAGIQSVDLVLIFKNRSTLENIGEGSFTLGGDISVAAGPVGRSSTARTDYKLDAEVYSYSRSKGLFAGISLGGSAITVDDEANKAFYGKSVDSKTVFSTLQTADPSVQQLKDQLKSMYQ